MTNFTKEKERQKKMPIGVYKHPPQCGFQKGHSRTPWNKGKKLKPLSEEHRKKISKTLKGNIPWNKDKKGVYSIKTLEKMSKAHRGMKKPWAREYMLHRKVSEKTKKKMSKWALTHPEKVRQRGFLGLKKQATMKGPTSIEKKVYDELKKRGLLFEKQKLINGHFLVDAYIPVFNLIIEADGDYWHSLPRVIKRDKSKNAYLKKCGFNLLRLTETEINNGRFNARIDALYKRNREAAPEANQQE